MSEREATTEAPATPEPVAVSRPGPQALATTSAQMLRLQRTAGNRAASRMVAEGRLARTPVQVRSSFTEAPTGTLGAIVGTTAFEIDFAPLEATLTVRIRLVPDAGIPTADVDRVKADAAASFSRLWDGKFILDDGVSHERFFLRARVVFVDSGGHLRVRLKAGDGDIEQTKWHVQDLGIECAHEISHTLGLFDEYVDPQVVRRRTATSPGVFSDHSLMGNYFTEGIAEAEVKLRHAQRLAATIGRATRRRFTASYSGPYIGERIVRWRGIRDGLTAGTPERAAAASEVEAMEREMMIPELSGLTGTPYVPTP